MRHVIVIETPDEPLRKNAYDAAQEFQTDSVKILEYITASYFRSFLIRSSFHQVSAVTAVRKMYEE